MAHQNITSIAHLGFIWGLYELRAALASDDSLAMAVPMAMAIAVPMVMVIPMVMVS